MEKMIKIRRGVKMNAVFFCWWKNNMRCNVCNLVIKMNLLYIYHFEKVRSFREFVLPCKLAQNMESSMNRRGSASLSNQKSGSLGFTSYLSLQKFSDLTSSVNWVNSEKNNLLYQNNIKRLQLESIFGIPLSKRGVFWHQTTFF